MIKCTSKTNLVWHILIILTFGMASLIVLTVLFWTLFPYNPADIKVPIQVLNENHKVAVGQPIKLKVELDKYTDITPKVDVFLLCNDGSLIELQSQGSGRPVGNYVLINDKYKVPERALTGIKCTFNFRNSYKVNPIREVVKNWYSEQFEIVKE